MTLSSLVHIESENSRPAQCVVSYRIANLSNVGRGRHVTTAAGPVDVNVLALGEVLVGVFGLDAESVGTKVVTLGLQQVGGKFLGAITVVEAEGSAEGGKRDTPESRLADDVSPATLGVVDGLVEEVVEEKVLEVGVVTVGIGDVLEEDRADDAATTPHEGNGRLVQLPAIFLSSLLDEHEALGVGDNLGGIKSLLEVVDESLLVTVELGGRATKDGAGTDTVRLESTQATGEDSLANESDGHAQVKGVDGGPLAGTLLTSLVKDFLNKRRSIVVVVVEDVTSDFDQEGVKDTFVPVAENIGDLLDGEAQTTLQKVISLVDISNGACKVWFHLQDTHFTDELHVTVLNTVVNHLDEVTSPLVTNPVTAGLTVVTLGGNALEDVLDVGPGLLMTTGHERGAVTGTLLTTGDTATDKAEALLGEVLGTAVAVGEVRVTTIDDDVTLVEVRQKGLDELINGFASHDQEHDTAGTLELGAELLDGVSTDNGLAWRAPISILNTTMMSHPLYPLTLSLTLGLIVEETVDLGGGTVVGADSVAVIRSVEDQVLTHDRQTDQTEISTGQRTRRSADIDAGEAGAGVSFAFSCQQLATSKDGEAWGPSGAVGLLLSPLRAS